MKKALATVLFMVGLTTVFIAAIAWVNAGSRARIAENQRLFALQSLLYAGGLLPEGVDESTLSATTATADLPWDDGVVLDLTLRRIRPVTLAIDASLKSSLPQRFQGQDSVTVQVVLDDSGRIIGYGLDLRGKGLWGSLGAVTVLDSSLTSLRGLDFTEQSETPGLGARITEQWFKFFFRGLRLDSGPVGMVGVKRESNLQTPTADVQAVTGATLTSNGVVAMVNGDLPFYRALLALHRNALHARFHGDP